MNYTTRRLFLAANALLGVAGFVFLHFANVTWPTMGMTVFFVLFAFGTGIFVGAVESDLILGRER